ncbi:MAG: hypothetical protein NVS3B10_23960 [Polyangiales bacterium]
MRGCLWIAPVLGAALSLVACGGSQSQRTARNVDPTLGPTAHGGGPRDDANLPPSPYNSGGGEYDDTKNSTPASEGVAPTSQQSDAKAESTVKGAKPLPNGRR